MGVDIGPGVLGLTLLQEHIGHDLVKLGNQLKHGVIGQVLQGKLALAGVTRVRLPQDGVAVAWHNLRREDTVHPTPELRLDSAKRATTCDFCSVMKREGRQDGDTTSLPGLS